MGQSCVSVLCKILCISSTCELELHSIKVFPCWAPWRVESTEDEVLFNAIMGLNKRKKANASLSSSEADLTDNEQDSHPLPQVFPRFIIIESEDENSSVTSLSPFVIQKVLQSISGEPKSIKKLSKSNQLLVEVSRKAHAENLLRTQTFHNLKVRVRPHSSLNSSRGVIRCPDLRGCSEKEILDEMKPQGVTAVKRFRVKKDGQLKDTNTFVFTFNTQVLPPTIKIAFLRVNVEIYIPNSLRCFNCQQYGHHEDRCKNHPVCSRCGEPAIHHETLCKNPLKCANCGESHDANSKECKIWHKEKEILRVKFTRNISFPEARKAVESPVPVPGSSYASIIKPSIKPISLTDASTQTDPVTVLPLQESSTTQTQNSHPQQPTTNEKEKSTSSQGQGKQASKEEPVLKKATLEMMRKDWQKQQQRERQMNNKSSSPNTNKQNKNDKSHKQSTNKHMTSNREQKGSKDEIQLHNKFESLSDESDMEFVDSIDHLRAGSSKPWSPILPP